MCEYTIGNDGSINIKPDDFAGHFDLSILCIGTFPVINSWLEIYYILEAPVSTSNSSF